jgi:glyoxylase-like metal-dependent hydrolase (beta-lactamase superfamily II)
MWSGDRAAVTSVRVVCEGRIRRENGMVVEAHSTSTLITGGSNILVDTSSREYRDRLLNGLERAAVAPAEIDMVVSTHLHHDHVGNNDLFPHATMLARGEEGPGRGYEAVFEDGEVAAGVRLMHTPGHTRGSMSVVVQADDATYVIAGDALPTRDNYDKWVPPGINYDPEVALASMDRVIEIAEIIVPGHGAAFPNEKSRLSKR